MIEKLKTIKELFTFIIARKKWWIFPVALLLVVIGAMLFLAQGSVFAPFIYTIF